ncbi:unnamed protein product [Effrenium voratum]|nr:unnamed protein product [Effrenium voratum]
MESQNPRSSSILLRGRPSFLDLPETPADSDAPSLMAVVAREMRNPVCLCWGAAVLLIYAYWARNVVVFFPLLRNREDAIEAGLTAVLHICFMDLVPNYFTGMALHRVPCLVRIEHSAEHNAAIGGRMDHLLQVTFGYACYTLIWMVLLGTVVSATSPMNIKCYGHVVWNNWRSAMWIVSFLHNFCGFLLRIWLWTARRFPSMYSGISVRRKMARFYWSHFHFNEWHGGVSFGNVTPYYDVALGTCPYNIPYSTPIPLVDYLIWPEQVFIETKHPNDIKWNWKQRVWHLLGACYVIGSGVLLWYLQQVGYLKEACI